MSDNVERQRDVLVAIQRALLGEISASLRVIKVYFTDTSIAYLCYYDGEIRDDDIESMSVVETHLIADFPDDVISHRVHRCDYPELVPGSITDKGIWVYARHEDSESPTVHLGPEAD